MADPDWTPPTLVGERVVLRPMVAADAEPLWEMVNDPEGRDLTATTATFDRPALRAWCASRADATDRLDLTIVERATGDVAGEAVLNEYDATTRSANFRIALRGPAWYGRGLGGEATRLIVGHGLDGVGLRRVTLGVLARNERARRAYERAGFVEIGRAVEDGVEWIDMAITRDGAG